MDHPRGTIRSRLRRAITSGAPLAFAALFALSGAGTAAADINGPDVASWQHDDSSIIDWFAVRNSGHEFAMIKATEGLDYINPFFVPDTVAARLAGVARGAYHFARPQASPEAQAAFFAATVIGVNGPPGDLPPILDLENSGGLPPAALIDWTHRFLNTVEGLTRRVPIIYTYPNFWKTAMANTNQFIRYPLWIADYRGNAQPELVGGWPVWTFWQYTDRGVIPGIAGTTDLNFYSGAMGPLDLFSNNLSSGSGSAGS
ncbi:glycoside hydrolase family 25 protein [Aldersonia sp. NBC_00410]|uniref:glycoside hydrolase family 25 protein n=1 Tax=Aldersonia sp. NBC_00410 TaxID=2975954 RepID=UPI0022527F6A|nr:glycoside hydrolase family 25 protein [Aldersonia sp. NBC_00410]MCX5044950.1 glycoside hydrolase family 25 protein [Aldersonia sp. NBC_00410]